MIDAALRVRLDAIADAVIDSRRIDADAALLLLRHETLTALGTLADLVRRARHTDGVVTYIVDRNINYTNVCNAFCSFCAFYRPPHHEESWTLPYEAIEKKVEETYALGGNQILLQGGHNPQLKIEYYEDLFRRLKQRFPDLWLHALSAPEIVHIYRSSRISLKETLERLVDLLSFLLPRYQREGKSYVTIGIGCTGGRHRSVYLAEAIARRLVEAGFSARAEHRDVEL